MGILGDHIEKTTGNEGSTEAKAAALALWNKTIEFAGTRIDNVAGNDAFDLLEKITQFNLAVLSLFNGGTAPQALGSGTTPATPSLGASATPAGNDSERLGLELVRICGGKASDADSALRFLDEAFKAGPETLKFLAQLVANIVDDGDKVVKLSGGRLTLQSVATIISDGEKATRAFMALVDEINGTRVTGEIDTLRADAITTFKTIKAGANPNLHFEAVRAESGITPNASESFRDYFLRVLQDKSALSVYGRITGEVATILNVVWQPTMSEDQFKDALVAELKKVKKATADLKAAISGPLGKITAAFKTAKKGPGGRAFIDTKSGEVNKAVEDIDALVHTNP